LKNLVPSHLCGGIFFVAVLKNEWVNKKKDFYDLSFPATAWNPEEIANNINYLKHIFVFKYYTLFILLK